VSSAIQSLLRRTSNATMGWISQIVPRVLPSWSGCSPSMSSQPLIRTLVTPSTSGEMRENAQPGCSARRRGVISTTTDWLRSLAGESTSQR
jgi:hypothetical protein